MKKVIKESDIRKEVRKHIQEFKRNEINENIRCRHHKCNSIREDVMHRYFNIHSNNCKPALLEKITLDRVIKKHGDNGYVIVSANRSNDTAENNDVNTNNLINAIKQSGFTFLPTYGGYRGGDGVEDDYEPSFIVFNYDKNGKQKDIEELKQLAVQWCKDYNQDSVLVKDAKKIPLYVGQNGGMKSKDGSFDVKKNDPSQEFFTSFKTNNEVEKEVREKLMGMYKTYCHKNNIPLSKNGFEQFLEQNRNKVKSLGRRITLDVGDYLDNEEGTYVNPRPQQMSECQRREQNGEIIPWHLTYWM